MCDISKTHVRQVGIVRKEVVGRRNDTIPLYLPNAALVREKRGKSDMRS